MALSLLSHPSYTDLQTFFDPTTIRLNSIASHNNNHDSNSFLDYYTFANDQMEFHTETLNVQQLTSNHHQNGGNSIIHQINTSNNSNSNNSQHFNDYEQVINFVDSPPNSKESWPGSNITTTTTTTDYPKDNPGPTIVNVQTLTNRKRRMDWEELHLNEEEEAAIHNTKVRNIGDEIHDANDKQHEEKKKSATTTTGRASWADDIDFDLNGEFSNNGYLNNAESFLSFSPTLAVLKQEIQSPNSEVHSAGQPQKGNKSPHHHLTVHHHQQQQQQQQTPENNLQDKEHNLTNTNNIIHQSTENGSPQQQQQQQLHDQSGSHSPLQNNNLRNATALGGGANNFQQLLSDNLENGSACNSPHQTELIKGDIVSDDNNKFQYILAAATSIATKSNEETLTYLNQGQSYEIKLKKIGDLSFYRDKILKSVIKICFHERRLQYMEREQMHQWQAARPGERIIEIDVPLSYGLCHVVSQSLNPPPNLNTIEILWDPLKEVGVYIKVNCISTEFTPKKHGGEKGVPFRIQIETYLENPTNNTSSLSTSSTSTTSTSSISTNINNNNNNSTATIPTTATLNNNSSNNNNNSSSNTLTTTNNNSNSDNIISLGKPIHAAACQIKVFKLKGADRKHKQDREKIQRRPPTEQEKYQPSYECTILNDIALESITPPSGCYSPEYMKIWPNSPVHMPKYDGGNLLPFSTCSSSNPPTITNIPPSPIAINNVTSTNTKLIDQNMVSPPQQIDMDDYVATISKEATPAQVSQWLTYHRLGTYLGTFAHFSGSDFLRMSKEDLIQVCGLADGIRMFNTLHAKAITPRLTIYMSFDGNSYHAIYLISNTIKELTQKIFKLPGFFEMCANGVESANGYPGWGLLSKYSGSGSNIYNDASKLNIYTTGPAGIHVMVNDEVLSNAIKDNSLYTLEMLNGKVIMKAVNKIDN